MFSTNTNVQNGTDTVTALQLKQILAYLSKQQSIGFRYRIVGELWARYHMRVESIIDTNKVLLYCEPEQKHHVVRINSIMQFDLDNPLQSIKPHVHMNVVPSPELDNEDFLVH